MTTAKTVDAGIRSIVDLELDPGEINFDRGDRLDELRDEAAIAALAESMARNGLMQPIGVCVDPEDEETYQVVFGRRRLAAARKLKWKSIRARVFHFDSEDELIAAREVENLHRQDLNPMEEALAVAQLLEAIEPLAREKLGIPKPGHDQAVSLTTDLAKKLKAETVRLAAERLAKSEAWVRDRAFLGKLSGRARDLVICGRLPLSHAREISKLADPVMRDQLAVRAASGHKPSYGPLRDQPMELWELKREVARNLLSLSQVPWQLAVPFANAPACSECPDNSANQPGLFDHGSSFSADRNEAARTGRFNGPAKRAEPSCGVCTRPECFARKSAAANRAIAGGATKTGRLAREQKTPISTKIAAGVIPLYVAAEKVVQVAKSRQRSAKKGAASKSKTQVQQPKPKSAEQVAKDRHEDAVREWARAQLKAITKAAAKTKCGLAGLLLFAESKIYRDMVYARDEKKRERALSSPGFARLVKLAAAPNAAALAALGEYIPAHRVEDVFLDDIWDAAGVIVSLSKAMGLKEEPPKFEAFLEEARKAKTKAPPPDAGDDEGDEE